MELNSRIEFLFSKKLRPAMALSPTGEVLKFSVITFQEPALRSSCPLESYYHRELPSMLEDGSGVFPDPI